MGNSDNDQFTGFFKKEGWKGLKSVKKRTSLIEGREEKLILSSRTEKKTLHLGADKKNDPFTSSSIKQAGLEVGKKLEFKQTLIRASRQGKRLIFFQTSMLI